MKSGLHVSEYGSVGVIAPGSSEARAAIERAGREHNGGSAWRPGAALETTRLESKRSGNQKLTEEQVRAIKRAIRSRQKPLREIATDFGTSLHTVKAISCGKAWADVEIDDDEVAA